MTRVAALQFASGSDVAANLATCLRMIDLAAEQQVELMVLPEFCNHISWYEDVADVERVAVTLDGAFLAAIAGRARQHRCYIVINVSLLQSAGVVTVSSVLFDASGARLAVADKQTLMGHENEYFRRATSTSPVVATPFGRLGIFPCRDGVTFETPRGLALRGAQLFCDSLNSFALDEASLHVPARAPENKVFLVAANKVGPLIPAAKVAAVSRDTHIPQRFLMGAGESQVVAPDGTVLAKGPREGEAVVVADIDLNQADNKQRPDGSDSFAARRPELYARVCEPPAGPYAAPAIDELQVALVALEEHNDDVLPGLLRTLQQLPAEVALAVLPELFFMNGSTVHDPAAAGAVSQRMLTAIVQALAGRESLQVCTLLVCTTLVLPWQGGWAHCAVLIGQQGLVASQPQLHRAERLAWSQLGTECQVFDLPWGRCAMLCGDDAIYPELAKVAALQGAHVLLVPYSPQEQWEYQFGLPSRAAENRVCVVACAPASQSQGGMIASLERDFTILTPWQERQFDGYINQPLITRQHAGAGVTVATIHPGAAVNKLMSARTDLLQDRPWQLCQDIVDCGPALWAGANAKEAL